MVDDAAVEETLRRILASAVFAGSPRMSRFLRFVVDETVAGRGGDLKEYVVGLRVFDKPESFNPAVDPTVRVEASKLRAKLARYYELEGQHEPVVVEIPKGHYAAGFSLRPRSVVSYGDTVDNTALPSPTHIPRRAALALSFAALMTAVGYTAYVLSVPRPITPTNGRIMLAVLPFQNLTGDPEQEYLCDGLTEEMIAQMSAVNAVHLGIIARTSAMHYKSTTKRADEIGRELGVQYLLETSLRRIGNRLRITAQLVDARSQSHVWVEQYERPAEDLLAVQHEVAAAVTNRTAATLGLSRKELDSTTKHQAKNSLVYEHYLRGRYHVSKGSGEGLRKAQEHFQQAITLDPSYAPAYSGLADTYALLGSYDVMPLDESHQWGKQAALKALELDDSLAEAHRSLAAIIGDHYWQWADADQHYRRAIELAPNDASTLRSYAFYLAYTGRPLEALPLAEQARRLDPVSPNARMTLGSVLYLARRFDAAVHEFEETLDLDQNAALAHALLGLTYISKGMPDRAVAEVQAARALSTRPDVVAFRGYILARAGRTREAQTAIEDLHRLARPRSPSPFLVALVYTGLEDNDRAFEWLAKAADARAWEMPNLKASPIFDELRSDSRFDVLLNRVGLPSD
jgi:TolB-like protein/Tfp pilus assembly protein PilF